MTAKEYKYLNILKDYFAASGAEGWSKAMNAALGYDYPTAVLLWEYALTENESRLSRPEYADVYADATEALFEKKNASRFARMLLESQVIRNAVYRFSRTSLGRAETVGYLANLLVAGKTDDADEIIRCASRNTAGGKTFGQFLLAAVERTIIELLKKGGGKSPMPRKVSSFILENAEKVKGPEKALIIQKVKEIL